MGWFKVVKGAYPGLEQVDRTLPVGSSETGIQRGSLIYEDNTNAVTGPVFRLAGAAQAAAAEAYLFFSLIDQTNLTAGMAGTVGQGVPGGAAKVTGLAIGMPLEIQTDQYDTGVGLAAGDLVTVGAGGLITAHATGQNCIGQVTVKPGSRYVNDAVLVPGYSTGANVSCVRIRTMWVPLLAGVGS